MTLAAASMAFASGAAIAGATPGEMCNKSGSTANTVVLQANGVVKIVANNLNNTVFVTKDGADLVGSIDNSPGPGGVLLIDIPGAAENKVEVVACEGNDVVDIIALTRDGHKVSGGEGSDFVLGSAGDDIIRGGDGNDFLLGFDGDDNIDGGGDDDALWGGDSTNSGGDGNDNLKGGQGTDQLVGEAGDDKLSGGSGDDNLFGGADDDKLLGQGGNDNLNPGPGFDDNNCGSGKSDSLFGVEAGETVKKCENVT